LEILRDTLAAVGIEARTTRPVLHCPRERREQVAALLAAAGLRGGDYGVLLPGSQAAGYLKRWGAARYRDLARALRAEGTGRVVILGGPDEIEECARIAEGCGEAALDLCGKIELLDIVPICEGARFIVGNDTGTAHVASAAGRPMVVICGPTDPRRVLPAGEHVVALQAALPCINCYRKHCAHHSCMALITPKHVLSKLAALLPRGVDPARH
jgi:heptosyltransferase-2